MRTPAHARLSTCASQFSFSKNPGGLNINIFCENWHQASFYNFLSFKNIFLPSKSGFLVFEEKPCKKLFDIQNSAFLSFETTTLKKLFFILSYCFSYKNYSWTNVVLVIIFENALKMAKMAFLMNNICCAFSKIPPKRKFVLLWFL